MDIELNRYEFEITTIRTEISKGSILASSADDVIVRLKENDEARKVGNSYPNDVCYHKNEITNLKISTKVVTE